MIDGQFPIGAAFVEDYREEITAAVTLVLAIAFAQFVDRTLAKRGRRLTEAVSSGGVSAATGTRLRLLRRLIFATIIVLGIALALSQFEAVKRVATGILASSAVLGLVVGFAARQTLANAVAGVLLAITQPIRVGDLVTFEDETGTVEDVRLTYTFIRLADQRRLVVPNERLAQGTILNHTIVDPRVHVEVSVWIAPDADAARALAVLGEQADVDVSVADIEKDGVRLSAGTWAPTPEKRGEVAADLRLGCHERLRAAGLTPAAPA